MGLVLLTLSGPILTFRILAAALRERLQSEAMRRKLAEELCENERRRRKLAEGMLDDARREHATPVVVPAMMDAFAKIAQLTGEALMATDSQDSLMPHW